MRVRCYVAEPMTDPPRSQGGKFLRILTLFGTRPEVIKLAPVIRALEAAPGRFVTRNVASGQHAQLLHPFARELGVRVDEDLRVGCDDQTPSEVCRRILETLGPLLERERPAAILVQGDTTTAFAGALAGFYAQVPVAHVEAGLRSGDLRSPYPEEMNRRLITQLASYHFAATARNRATLRAEGVPAERIALTGNPIVDSVQWAVAHTKPSSRILELLRELGERRLVLLTTHRRESFGDIMQRRLCVLRRFVERHPDVALVFPVHPNPNVRIPTHEILAGLERVHLVAPLDYADFVQLLSRAWLVVSDSGGVQEEAPSLGRPVLVIRDNTERTEAIEAGVARLVGRSPEALEQALEGLHADPGWCRSVTAIANPFGAGDAGPRIADALSRFLADEAETRP